MKKVSPSTVKNNFDHFYELAHIEPIHMIEGDDEPKVVMIPYFLYKEVRKAWPREALHVSELPREIFKEILETDYSDEEEPPES